MMLGVQPDRRDVTAPKWELLPPPLFQLPFWLGSRKMRQEYAH